MFRRPLLAIALLAAILHGVGIFRSPLPAQDGLKFLRVARDFHHKSWIDAIRGSDQHPLYPALIAAAQPLVSPLAPSVGESWRVSAQLVSTAANLATLLLLFHLAKKAFDSSKALMACLLFVLLPLPTALGHETLSDALAIFWFTATIALGVQVHASRNFATAVCCGIVGGLGYLTRPELAIVPVVIVCWIFVLRLREHQFFESLRGRQLSRVAALSFSFLFLVGSYALIKGEVSEKLALRRATAVSSKHDAPAARAQALPPGLDDPRWDFSAKEESNSRVASGYVDATILLGSRWLESLGVILAPLAIIGLWRARREPFALLFLIYASVFGVIVTRHTATFGYLSSRHVLTLMILCLPLVSSAILDAFRAVRVWRENRAQGSVERTKALRWLAIASMIAIGLSVQFHRPPHQSRWGHSQAGLWLAAHAPESSKVMDTRGWANFVSGREGHDYWHVRQALSDPALGFIVVGEDERTAASRRGETLRAILAYAGEVAAEFPDRKGGQHVGVRIYRIHLPEDWRGMTP